MKKSIFHFCFLLICTVVSSCVSKVEDLFDKPAAQRMNEALHAHNDILAAAPNGWVMYYYPESKQSYGGTIFLMKFDKEEGYVYVGAESARPAYATERGTYSLIGSQGPVLSIDSYIDLFNIFSDPGLPVGGGEGFGYEGDIEFALKKVSAQEIEMQGTRTGNKIFMYPMPEDMTWEDYLSGVTTIKQQVADQLYTNYILSGGSADVELSDDDFPRMYITKSDGTKQYFPYTYTNEGIRFYEPTELGGMKLQEFVWDNAARQFNCVNAGATQAVLTPSHYDGFRHYNEFLGTWTLACDYMNNSAWSPYSVPVIFEEVAESVTEVKYTKMKMTGYNIYPVTLMYRKATSSVEMKAQYLGTYAYSGLDRPVYLFCGTGAKTPSVSLTFAPRGGTSLMSVVTGSGPAMRIEFTDSSGGGFNGVLFMVEVGGEYLLYDSLFWPVLTR